MLHLPQALTAWNTDQFRTIFIDEVMHKAQDQLPLQQALQFGSYASTEKLQIMVNSFARDNAELHIQCGVFFSSVIAGCNCADDPTPVEHQNEYCEVCFSVDCNTAATSIKLLNP